MRPTLRFLLFLLLVLPSPLAAAGGGRETDRLNRTTPGVEPQSTTPHALPFAAPPPVSGTAASGGRYTTLQGYYDYQSNTGPVRSIVLDSLRGSIHTIYMFSADSANPAGSRRTGYSWTTNEGLTWQCNTTTVPNVVSGYPSLDLLTDMAPFSPVIANHNPGSGGPNLTWAYLGDTTCFFTELLPVPSVSTPEPIWPQVAALPTGGVIIHSSVNDATLTDAHKNYLFRTTDFTTWTSTLVPVLDGSGGRYDILADRHSGHVATTANGDSTILWESTDYGATWGPVQVVHLPVRITGTPAESLGVWSGPDLLFYHGSPVVAINTSVMQDGGTSFLFAGSRIEVWRPGTGYRTAVMWDSLVHPRLMVRQSNHLSLGYPSLGLSGDVIVMAYQAFLNDEATRDSLSGGRFFSEIFLVQSTDGGETWSLPVNITNTPQLDERYPSMSRWNPAGTAYLTYQEDTRAGSHINDEGVPKSLSKQVLYKADLNELFPMNDVAAQSVLQPPPSTVLTRGNPFTPEARFRNVGLAGQSGVPVRFELVNGAGTVVHTSTGTIPSLAAGDYSTVTFSPVPGTVTGSLDPGVYTTRAVAQLGTDTNHGNDTVTSAAAFIATVVVSTSYLEDFEPTAPDGGSYGWFALREDDARPPDWVVGTPAKTQISGAHSGQRCWVTRLTGQHSDDEESFLASPAFDLSGLPSGVQVDFWHNFQMEEEWDGGVLQYSTDAGVTWVTADQILGTGPILSTTTSTFWYNEDEDSSGTVFGVPMFSMSSTGYPGHRAGWIRSSTLLPVGGLADVRFRFRWSSDAATAYDGWAIDDFGLRPPVSSVTVSVLEGWNMVSRPVATTQDSVRQLFPTASSEFAFAFTQSGGYEQRRRLDLGTGYWVKFPAPSSPELSGGTVPAAAIPVDQGWNLVGSISGAVDTALIGSEPPGLRASLWYGFTAGYTPAAQLQAGRAYWVKSSAPGFFVFTDAPPTAPSAARPLTERYNTITVRDAVGHTATLYFGPRSREEDKDLLMPPPPPDGVFDVRFIGSDGALLRNHEGVAVDMPIGIRDATGPVEVAWSVNGGGSYMLADATSGRILTPEGMQDRGAITIPGGTRMLALRGRGDQLLPREAALEQNYPNPFNPVTTITFAVPGNSVGTLPATQTAGGHATSLQVFDVLGRQVATLVDDTRPPGIYTATFDAAQLASGMYIYRLTVGGFTATRSMMLLK
jgi:hypothetical protein